MCGIAGIYYFDRSRKVEARHLKLMTDAIVHRGPDDEGAHAHENVGLAMRRLSIIDLSGGHQPIFTADRRSVIVFNGEVYNFVDYRDPLISKGYQFQTRTDTEVVLNLYSEYGIDFLERLNGMFGLAIYDNHEQRLIVARDRIGIKQLYYYQDAEKLVFASEIKAITALPFIRPDIDMEGLGAFLKYGFTPAPYTMFKNIRKIPPAHSLIVENGAVRLHKYWHVSYADKLPDNEKQVTEGLYDLLKDAVRYRLVADVPLGAFLSGGMDSSGIVHLMSEINKGSEAINTYSIGFGKGYEFYNELGAAGQFAGDYKTSHHEILVEPNVVELFPRLVRHLDEPLADSSFIVTYLVSELARKTVTVILSGVGGDELFGGYRRYLNVSLNKYAKVIPHWFRQRVMLGMLNRMPVDRNSPLLNLSRLARAYIHSTTLPIDEQYASYMSIFDGDVQQHLRANATHVPDLFQTYYDECDSDDLLDKIMYFDLKTSLPEQLLMLTDKMTMAASIEGRVPFLDHRMVEYAARIPNHMKLKGFKLRWVQKRAFQGKIPDYVLSKKKKGFGAPVGAWIRNDLREMVHDLLHPDTLRQQGVFDPVVIAAMLEDHYEMRQDYNDQILALLTFQIWYQEYIQQPVGDGMPA